MLGENKVHCGLLQNCEKVLGHVFRASSKNWPRTNHLKKKENIISTKNRHRTFVFLSSLFNRYFLFTFILIILNCTSGMNCFTVECLAKI